MPHDARDPLPVSLRVARVEDAPALAAIYRPYVADTAITFEVEPPDAAEFARRIAHTLEKYPYLVAEDPVTGELLGYAYTGAFKGRAAYDWSVETSIYVAQGARGRQVVRGCTAAWLRRAGCRASPTSRPASPTPTKAARSVSTTGRATVWWGGSTPAPTSWGVGGTWYGWNSTSPSIWMPRLRCDRFRRCAGSSRRPWTSDVRAEIRTLRLGRGCPWQAACGPHGAPGHQKARALVGVRAWTK